MDRRNLLRLLTISGAGTAMGIWGGSFTRALATDAQVDWGYVGSESPTYWGDLSPKYQACKLGQMQSPINLQGAIKAELPTIQIAYHNIPLRIVNNGHAIQVNVEPGNQITLNGKMFDLIQFHFHHPSEHLLMNQVYPMEVHLVHQNQTGELAVLGVFFKAGKENAVLDPIWKAMSSKRQPEQIITGVKVPIAGLIPSHTEAYEYFGSLTTPPCSEIVNWVVFHNPIEVSPSQIDQFKNIFFDNARPIQPVNHRFILDVD